LTVYRAILIPLDGSAFAESALPLAIGLAERSKAVVHIVHVASSALEVVAMREYLDAVRDRFAHRVGAGIQTELLTGTTEEVIAEYVTARGIDLVVLATHGRGGVSRAWLGSVAESLIAALRTPVLLHRPTAGPTDGAVGAVLPRSVFVPIDRSEVAPGILTAVEQLATVVGAEVVLAMVIAPMDVRAEVVSRMRFETDEVSAAQHGDAAREYLEALADPMRARGLRVRVEVFQDTHAATGILQGAASAESDVIAMATHARRGWSRVVLGSITDKVVRGTSKTMLLNRPVDPAAANGD
jgi:nucleotide-binding universal stress UspA family protein